MAFLEGKVALVTGASRGIGAATAEALAQAGAHVILVARTSGGLEAVEERIHAAGGSATIAPLDLTDGDSIGKLATAIGARWKALDMLILNAAQLGSLSPVVHIDAKEFAKTLTLNLTAQQAILAAFDPLLRAAPAGRVIGITSSAAHSPNAFWGAYGASKAAFEVLLTCYGEEVRNLAPLRVAIVDPGRTRTAMRAKAYPGEDASTLKSPEVVANRLCALLENDFETGHRERIAG